MLILFELDFFLKSISDEQAKASDPTLSASYKKEKSDVLSSDQQEIEMQSTNNNVIMSPEHQSFSMPPDCFPPSISKRFSCCGKCIPKIIQDQWTCLRHLAHRLTEHHFFEWFIIASIIVSSITLVSC